MSKGTHGFLALTAGAVQTAGKDRIDFCDENQSGPKSGGLGLHFIVK